MTTIDTAADTNEGIRPLAVSCAEDLRRYSHDQLISAYRNCRAPASVKELDGHPAGVGVAPIIFAGGRFDRWLRRYSESDRFIWHGKSFESFSDREGWGYNRIGVGPVLTAFPFRTYIGPSKIDAAPTLVLDFDVPKNPWWERPTWDEQREIAPGVFFGTTGLRLAGRYHPLAWFALDTNRQTPLIGA